MDIRLDAQPSYTIATVVLDVDESVFAESGSMAVMSDGIEVHAGVGPGGVVKAALRRQLGGETFFMTRFTAQVQGAWVALAPRYPGDIAAVDIDPAEGLMVESGSLLALAQGVSADVKFAGLTQVVLQEGVTMLRLQGSGKALLAAYGAVQRINLAPGQRVVVDTGHIVAYTAGMHESLRLGLVGGVVTAKLSGEGVAGQFVAPAQGGAVWIQTRAEQALRSWLLPGREPMTGHGTSGH